MIYQVSENLNNRKRVMISISETLVLVKMKQMQAVDKTIKI